MPGWGQLWVGGTSGWRGLVGGRPPGPAQHSGSGELDEPAGLGPQKRYVGSARGQRCTLIASVGTGSSRTPRPLAQIPVEPVDDPAVAVDAPVGATCRRVHVVLVRVEDVLDGPAEVAQRDEELLVVGRRAALVGLGL